MTELNIDEITIESVPQILKNLRYGSEYQYPNGYLVIRTDTNQPICDYRYPNRFIWSYSRFTKGKANNLLMKHLAVFFPNLYLQLNVPYTAEEVKTKIAILVSKLWTIGFLRLVTFAEFLEILSKKPEGNAISTISVNSILAIDKLDLNIKLSKVTDIADRLLSKLDITDPIIETIKKELEEVLDV